MPDSLNIRYPEWKESGWHSKDFAGFCFADKPNGKAEDSALTIVLCFMKSYSVSVRRRFSVELFRSETGSGRIKPSFIPLSVFSTEISSDLMRSARSARIGRVEHPCSATFRCLQIRRISEGAKVKILSDHRKNARFVRLQTLHI